METAFPDVETLDEKSQSTESDMETAVPDEETMNEKIQSTENDMGTAVPDVEAMNQKRQSTEKDMETAAPAVERINEQNKSQETKDDDNIEQSAEDITVSKNDQQMMGNHDIAEKLDLEAETQTTKDDNIVDIIADEDNIPTDNDQQKRERNDDHYNSNGENRTRDTDFQAGSSVDPPTETNVDNTRLIPEGTSVDPVTDTIMENRVPVQRRKLKSLEVPDNESKNEREQQAIKLCIHTKKKVLSCASKQLLSVITDCLVEEFSIPSQTETALILFVKKCSEVCLMMGLKDPPVYIDFMKEGIPDQTLFNAERYKAYTRKGKYVEYVVWPCLFLEKDGPLLSKGTAQGRND